MESNIFLNVNHVVKKFAAHTALNDVSISVPQGKIFGLLGPNGAGKTTLIRIITRITAPDSGEVFFKGRKMLPDDIYSIGYLPEERGLYKKMKVGDQAIYFAQLKGLSRNDAKARLKKWFEKFDIMQWWDKKVDELSKGMAQKVQFIATVLHEPELLIFDEPFSGFDPVNAELLKREILEFKKKGHTVIFSTHNMGSVEEICDDIALVNHSQVVLSGKVSQVKNDFRTGRYEVVATNGELASENSLYKISERNENDGNVRYIIDKTSDISNSALAAEIASQVEIRSFAEQIPTMNEIFLKIVSSQNN